MLQINLMLLQICTIYTKTTFYLHFDQVGIQRKEAMYSVA